MKPEKRKRKKTSAFVNTGQVKWTSKDAQTLYEALAVCEPDDYATMHQHLPHIPMKDIEVYLKKVIHQGETINEHDLPSQIGKTPIENWLQIAEGTLKKQADYSTCLPKALAIAGNLEPHVSKVTKFDVNFTNIYRYLSALLDRGQLPKLSAIECAVLLDIIQSLADDMESLDIDEHKQLIEAKISLYQRAMNPDNRLETLDLIHKAFDANFNPVAPENIKTIGEAWDSLTERIMPNVQPRHEAECSHSGTIVTERVNTSPNKEAKSTRDETPPTSEEPTSVEGVTTPTIMELLSHNETAPCVDKIIPTPNEKFPPVTDCTRREYAPMHEDTPMQEVAPVQEDTPTIIEAIPINCEIRDNAITSANGMPKDSDIAIVNVKTELVDHEHEEGSRNSPEEKQKNKSKIFERKKAIPGLAAALKKKKERPKLYSLNPIGIPIKYLNPRKK